MVIKMKYDFVIDYNDDNVWSKTAKQIKPGSTVLEFGSATGYFTRHLKEQLNCKVYIVELDKESFDHAILYAQDGICEDIEEYRWAELFKNMKFDYIIFLDVLEHLLHPENVLKKCDNFLTDDGSIIFSIPNIAHNSVLIDLFNNKFKYTEMGLLDNSHIRFFTYYQIIQTIERAGLYACNMQAIYKHVGETEIKNSFDELPADCIRQFKQRDFGDIYQFVFTCKKNNQLNKAHEIENNLMIQGKNYEALLYVKEYIYRHPLYGNENQLVFEIDQKDSNEIKIDLCNASKAIIKINYVEINGIKYEQYQTNAVFSLDSVNYYDSTPYIHVVTIENTDLKKVLVDLEFRMLDSDFSQFRKLISIIHQRDVELLNKGEQLRQREYELKQIYESKTYKFARKLQSAKQKLFK